MYGLHNRTEGHVFVAEGDGAKERRMNGDDVAVIRNDIQHLTTSFDEQRTELREWQKEQAARVVELEKGAALSGAWQTRHVKNHDKISVQLGELGAGMQQINTTIERLNGGARKAGLKGGVAGGFSLAALIEVGPRLLAALAEAFK